MPSLAVLLLAGASLLSASSSSQTPETDRLLGVLTPGPHAVGYRVIPLSDPTRPTGPKRTPAGAPVGDRARRISVHLWYPAASSAGAAMTLGAYVEAAAAPGQPAGAVVTEQRAELARLFGQLSDADWTAFTAGRMRAVRDAAPAAGRHPLLVGLFRPTSLTLTSEYLASHGYVVAFVQPPAREEIDASGAVMEALYTAQYMRDMELAVASLREQPFVDGAALGTLGFSGAGLPSLPLAMRFADVDAVALLETGFFGPQGSSYREMPAYDPSTLRAPYFYAYGVTLGQPDVNLAELQRMRYAPRVVLYSGEPRMHHWDYATEGPAVISLLNRRADGKRGVFRTVEAIHRNLLTFFNAYVRGDAAARAKFSQPSQEPGPGAMIELQVLPATVPAISRRDFRRLLDEDLARAAQQAREGLGRDPHGAVFEEEYLNLLGYELLNQRQGEKALAVFRLNADAHPTSVNALDSLSEALEVVGQRAAALEVAEKALAVLPADTTVQPAQRKQLEGGLRARIGRLKKG